MPEGKPRERNTGKRKGQKGEKGEKFDRLRAETVRSMAEAPPDGGTDPGERCLSMALTLNHTPGGVGALTGPPAGTSAGARRPPAIVSMPEEGRAGLLLEREPHPWLPEEPAPEEQETVDAYTGASAPAVVRTLRAGGAQTGGR